MKVNSILYCILLFGGCSVDSLSGDSVTYCSCNLESNQSCFSFIIVGKTNEGFANCGYVDPIEGIHGNKLVVDGLYGSHEYIYFKPGEGTFVLFLGFGFYFDKNKKEYEITNHEVCLTNPCNAGGIPIKSNPFKLKVIEYDSTRLFKGTFELEAFDPVVNKTYKITKGRIEYRFN